MKSTILSLMLSLASSSFVHAAVEYGIFEKSSDGKFQSVCPVQDDGSVICTYKAGYQQSSQKIDTVDLATHQQNLRALNSLSALSFLSYDEAIRKMIPTQGFLLNGFYVKYDSKTVIIDFAHFYSPLQVTVPAAIKAAVGALLKTLLPVYYAHTRFPTPLIKKNNLCPVLVGRFDCGRNTLLVTQRTYGVDDLYVFTYSDRTVPFDFAANNAGMKNALDKYLSQCSAQGLTLDGSTMRLVGMSRDLEFASGTSSLVCKRLSPVQFGL
jgi:hypothetical protein